MHDSHRQNLVLGITGASGGVYAVRLLEVLMAGGYDVHLSISPSGQAVLEHELGVKVNLDKFQASSLMLRDSKTGGDRKLEAMRTMSGISSEDSSVLSIREGDPGSIHYHDYRDMMSPIASGSFLTGGMVLCPCSGSTLSAIANAASTNVIQRAAEVHLKERRPLIAVPRETPLSLSQLDNMRRAVMAGAVMLPAAPGWYHGVETLQDLVDFVVARICDQLHIPNSLVRRWGD